MAQSEVNVISHLIEVEQKANDLVKSAQSESNEKIAVARAKADSLFNSEYENLIQQLESDYNSQVAFVKEQAKNQLDNYKKTIEETNQNKEAFSALLKNILEK